MERRKRDTVYYLESKGDTYVLPTSDIKENELLHEGADRIGCACGLDHFVVGKMCVANEKDTFYLSSRLWKASKETKGGFFTKNELRTMKLVDESILNIMT